MTDIIHAVNEQSEKPLFVKISPDLKRSELDGVIKVVMDNKLAGIIAVNSTDNQEIKHKYGKVGVPGGISGSDADYRNMATQTIKYIYKEVGGLIIIIGVGGINNWETALEKDIRWGDSFTGGYSDSGKRSYCCNRHIKWTN